MNYDFNKLITLLHKDNEIKLFCKKYNLTNEEILNNLGKFKAQEENNKICAPCLGKSCAMDPYGMKSKLNYDDNKVELIYYRCPLLENNLLNLNLDYFPDNHEFFNNDIHIIPKRAKALRYIQEFEDNYKKGVFTKGIFFYGAFGTGKTYLMFYLAKKLAQKGVKVLFAYYPDLVRQMKSGLSNNELEGIIIKLKNAEVLCLDDVGAENNNAFIRDEVLGPILQVRLHNNLPVCMTSNLSFQGLGKHFSESRDEIDLIKSGRIMERLRYLMKELKIDDINYRSENNDKKD
jgi:primosomal protein DnaI